MPAALFIIGKILLWILIVLAVLVALLLFFPFTYRGRVRKDGEALRANGKLYWLFHAIHAKIDYRSSASGPPVSEVYLFGLPLLRILRKRRERREAASKRAGAKGRRGQAARERYTGAKKRPTVAPRSEWKETEELPEVEIYHRREPGFLLRLGARISSFFGKIKRFFAKLHEIFTHLREAIAFLRSEQFTEGARVIKRQGILLLKHLRPRDIRGRIAFGFEDPSTTGRVLGAIGVFYPILPARLAIEPNFEGGEFEADVRIGGRFFGIVLLVRALKIFLNKNVRALFARFRAVGAKKKTADAGERAAAGSRQ